MREIKFRAWDALTREWVRFDRPPVHSVGGRQTIGVLKGSDGVVFMQFTGLTDKNGKEIYEGDVVRFIGEEYDERGFEDTNVYEHQTMTTTIKFKDAVFEPFDYLALWHSPSHTTMEVIGNIYENPELLTL